MKRAEELYQRLFELENDSIEVNESHIRWNNKLYSGADLEGDPSFGYLSIVQQDLIWALKCLDQIDADPQKLRIGLMKRFGIVSSMVHLHRSAPVAVYMSRPDAHPFSIEELEKLLPQSPPSKSKLLQQMLADPHLFDGTSIPLKASSLH